MTTESELRPGRHLQPGRQGAPPGRLVPDCPTTRPATGSLPTTSTAPHLAREFVRASACPAHLADREDAVLLVSELVTNAVHHGIPPIQLSCRCASAGVVFSISDAGPPQAGMSATMAQPLEQSGRGLALLEALSSDWGIDVTGEGKSVWFVLGGPVAPS